MTRAIRGGIYAMGILLLVMSATLNTKTGLGVSSMHSVSYAVSQLWNLDIGLANFFLYCAFVGLQMLLLRRVWGPVLLQLPFSFIFNILMSAFVKVIPYDGAAHSLWENLMVLALTVVFTGTGIALTINMRLIPHPGDGLVSALSQRMGWKLGTAKNIFDLCCVLITCALGLCFGGKVIGIGLGTLAAMFGTGRVVAAVNWLGKEKMCRAAGIE